MASSQNAPRQITDADDDPPQAPFLYAAEKRFSWESLAAAMRFRSAKETQRWIADLFASDEFAQAFPEAATHLAANTPRVKLNRNKRQIGSVDRDRNLISLSSLHDGIGMTLPTVVHEVSHVVDDHCNAQDPSHEMHGPSFAAAYLDMVSLTLGGEEAEQLQRDFETGEVEIGVRKVGDTGEGMISAGQIAPPSSVRTAETVAAERAKRITREAAKHWDRWTAIYSPQMQMRTVRRSKDYFDAVRAAGGTVPYPVEVILASGDESVPTHVVAVARRLAGPKPGRCVHIGERSGMQCVRAPHAGNDHRYH